LNENNLKLGSVKYEIDNYYPENVVSQQSIPENNQVISGESIDLTVSLGIEPTEFIVPNLVGKSLNDAKIAIKKAGLTLGDIEYQQTEKVLPNTVLDQSLEPKLEVSKHDTIGLVISKLLISEEDKVVW
jgi:serine/threonine-protein kinase